MENNVSFKVVGYFDARYAPFTSAHLEEHYSDFEEAVERAEDMKGNSSFSEVYVVGNQTGEILWGV